MTFGHLLLQEYQLEEKLDNLKVFTSAQLLCASGINWPKERVQSKVMILVAEVDKIVNPINCFRDVRINKL